MSCDLQTLLKQPQIWNGLDDNTILCVQIAVMCDALDGIDTTTFDLPTMLARVACINKLAPNTIMGMWTDLFSKILSAASGATSGGQIRNFVNDPNVEGVTPADITSPAVAYPVGGGTLFQWVVPAGPWV